MPGLECYDSENGINLIITKLYDGQLELF